MTKTIFVGGCSHVQGHGFPDNVEGIIHSKYAWPAIIEKNIDCKIHNVSDAGNSTDKVVRDFLNYKNKASLSAIIILFPNKDRFLLRNAENENENFCVGKFENGFSRDKKYNGHLTYYLKKIRNDEAEEINYLGKIALVQYFAQKHNIPFFMGFSDYPDKMLIESQLGLSDLFNWDRYLQDGYPKLPDGHAGEKAHNEFADIITKWLLSHGFQSR